QRVGGVVGVAQGLRAGDRVRRGVQRGPDRVVGALLPVSRARRARALSHLVRCRESEPPERPRVAHLRRERRERGGGWGGGGGLLQRDERKDESEHRHLLRAGKGYAWLPADTLRPRPRSPSSARASPRGTGADGTTATRARWPPPDRSWRRSLRGPSICLWRPRIRTG